MIIESGALTFDPVTHTYLVDGIARRSVTGILSDAGVIDKKYFNARAARRGSAVHEGIRLMLLDCLDWSSVDPQIEGYIKAAKKAIEELQIKPLEIEQIYYHDELEFCGTMDLIDEKCGFVNITDWKTGIELINYERLQLAMYQMLFEFNNPGAKIYKRRSIHLTARGTYKVSTYLDHVQDTNDAIFILKGGVYGNRNA